MSAAYSAVAMIACVVCWYVGWEDGHSTVASDCDRLGRFYVGQKVYECKLVKGEKA